MMFIAPPVGPSVLCSGPAYWYYLLGEHIVGVYWDDNDAVVFNAGTVSAPATDVDPYSRAYTTLPFTSLIGISVAQESNRLGLWTHSQQYVLVFDDIAAETLTLQSSEVSDYPVDWQPDLVVESSGRPLWEYFRLSGDNYELGSYSAGDLGLIVTADWAGNNVVPAYDGLVITSRPEE